METPDVTKAQGVGLAAVTAAIGAAVTIDNDLVAVSIIAAATLYAIVTVVADAAIRRKRGEVLAVINGDDALVQRAIDSAAQDLFDEE